ncbi:MAG: Uma2 family endonuclease [Bacteroidota bacterium]
MKSRISEPRPEAATKDLYTYGDYAKWPDEERWELIDGIPYNMSPAPSRSHQKILGDLHRQVANYLIGKTCEVYIAPFDVRLPKGDESDEQIDTVVQPDLMVVCDREKLDERGCKGAPDLVVEVLSPGTAGRDMKIKLALYERVGVKEYWLVDPSNKTVQVYQLETEDRYGRPGIYTSADRLKVGIFTDLEINLAMVFKD